MSCVPPRKSRVRVLALFQGVVTPSQAAAHANRKTPQGPRDDAQETCVTLLRLQQSLGRHPAGGNLADQTQLAVVILAGSCAEVIVMAPWVPHQLLRAAGTGPVCRHGLIHRADLVADSVDDQRGDLDLSHLREGAQRAGLRHEQPQHLRHHSSNLPDHGQLQEGHDARLHHERRDGLAALRREVHGAGGAQAPAVEHDARGACLVAGLAQDARQCLQHRLGVGADGRQPRLPTAPSVAAELRTEHAVVAALVDEAHLCLQVGAQLGVRVEVHEHNGLCRGLRVRRGVEPVGYARAIAGCHVAVDPTATVGALLRARPARPCSEGDAGDKIAVPEAAAAGHAGPHPGEALAPANNGGWGRRWA
mmetsp:Transcript_10277/g.31927  ORF Transcript_10277/g.31927 Transcript_10277/m.31927 type:complete len:363 (+) Transcript_10277:48-1136(+)